MASNYLLSHPRPTSGDAGPTESSLGVAKEGGLYSVDPRGVQVLAIVVVGGMSLEFGSPQLSRRLNLPCGSPLLPSVKHQ